MKPFTLHTEGGPGSPAQERLTERDRAAVRAGIYAVDLSLWKVYWLVKPLQQPEVLQQNSVAQQRQQGAAVIQFAELQERRARREAGQAMGSATLQEQGAEMAPLDEVQMMRATREAEIEQVAGRMVPQQEFRNAS